MNYKGLLLDLDNTLYNYDTAHAVALNESLKCFSQQFGLSDMDALVAFEKAKADNHTQLAFTAASHSRLFYFQRMLESIGAFDVKMNLKLDAVYWDAFYEAMSPDPYVLEFLSENHIPKCIITDFTAEPQFKKLVKLGIDPWIDHMVTSEEAGVEKPHPFIFMRALSKLGLRPDACLMIGDSYKKDCLGAQAVGIDSIYYKGEKEKEDVAKGIFVLDNFHDISHWME
jgi:putative hydrolase of the HAD superfamily